MAYYLASLGILFPSFGSSSPTNSWFNSSKLRKFFPKEIGSFKSFLTLLILGIPLAWNFRGHLEVIKIFLAGGPNTPLVSGNTPPLISPLVYTQMGN